MRIKFTRNLSGGGLLLAGLILFANIVGIGQALANNPSFAVPLNEGPDQTVINGMLAAASHTAWIGEGRGNPIVYVFFDPNCPYCHKLFLATRFMVKHGQLQLRWIPVGILTRTSMGKAAAMLEAANPRAAFYANEAQYHRTRKHGGLDPLADPEPATIAHLKANADVLARSKMMMVPTLLFRNKAGRAELLEGAPASGLRQLLGIARAR